MTAFVAQVQLRWSDQDSYGHLNNARAVTLLEEARIAFLWTAKESDSEPRPFQGGLLVAGLHADYRRQVSYRTDTTLRVVMGIDEVRAASFRIRYALHDGPAESDPVAIRAWTRMALFDISAQRPRRLTAAEQEYLAGFGDGSAA